MTLLRRALFMAAKRAASDPHIQAKAREFARDEVAPRVKDAIERAAPVANRAKKRASAAAGDLREAAREHPPLDDPKAFLADARRRMTRGG